ncbi:hypothetical protein NUW58_g2702 [Xylaria curta]|uniref:Uncharacterized protein n=1 Tax=Xylaria curta TaxID=42375 RepID=A0ACC1PG52_9PEZI|nr:hypothetical protein NUW58_g2702 [Xylaria curta]
MVATILVPVQPSTGFRGKLGPALDNQVAAGSVDRLPTVSECAVHLELLDAIVRVEGEVAAWSKEKGLAEEVAWNMYCSAAAQRFLKWSHLAEAHKGNTPPLDVLIVWHAYMLNTAAYRQYEKQVLKGRMGLKGINWAAVHRRIDEDNRFNISAEEAATTNHLPFPVDLLDALKNEQVKIDNTGSSPSTNFDMVAAVQRQLKFAHKMHDAKWLRSPFAIQILEAAIRRYEMFFTLIAEHPGISLSPTPDIDLVWHTHQLSPKCYGLYSAMKTNGKFINHNDNVGKPALVGAFDSAKTLFRERFGSNYQVCYYCSGDSCIPQTCSNSCKADCSGDSCQNDMSAAIGRALAPGGHVRNDEFFGLQLGIPASPKPAQTAANLTAAVTAAKAKTFEGAHDTRLVLFCFVFVYLALLLGAPLFVS